ncbi:MAG: hypothetical protein M3461_11160 [Pseudomonadota bacterium]|nr:hypothetical protein [Pseudomonadota bacterium]
MRPRLVRLRFDTHPRGLRLRIQGTMLRAPQNIISWPGYPIHVDTPKQIKKGKVRRFLKWSDGRKRRHIIRTPSKRRPYRAFFDRELVKTSPALGEPCSSANSNTS